MRCMQRGRQADTICSIKLGAQPKSARLWLRLYQTALDPLRPLVELQPSAGPSTYISCSPSICPLANPKKVQRPPLEGRRRHTSRLQKVASISGKLVKGAPSDAIFSQAAIVPLSVLAKLHRLALRWAAVISRVGGDGLRVALQPYARPAQTNRS